MFEEKFFDLSFAFGDRLSDRDEVTIAGHTSDPECESHEERKSCQNIGVHLEDIEYAIIGGDHGSTVEFEELTVGFVCFCVFSYDFYEGWHLVDLLAIASQNTVFDLSNTAVHKIGRNRGNGCNHKQDSEYEQSGFFHVDLLRHSIY